MHQRNRGRYCAASWCNNFHGCRVDNPISFFLFPKDNARCAQWTRFSLREDLLEKTPYELRNMVLCSDHFKETDFKTLYPRKLLHAFVCPSIVERGNHIEVRRSAGKVEVSVQIASPDLEPGESSSIMIEASAPLPSPEMEPGQNSGDALQAPIQILSPDGEQEQNSSSTAVISTQIDSPGMEEGSDSIHQKYLLNVKNRLQCTSPVMQQGECSENTSDTGISSEEQQAGSNNNCECPPVESFTQQVNVHGESCIMQYSSNSRESQELDRSLAMMIAEDIQPFSIVEDEGFRTFVTHLNPRYNLPTRQTVSDVLVPRLYAEAQGRLGAALAGACKVALTTDTWTSNCQQSFLAITAHFVHNGSLTFGCLGASMLSDKHTPESIATRLREVIASWDLEGKVSAVTTDNTASMQRAVKNIGLPHLSCVAQTMHLVVCDAIQSVEALSQLLSRCSDIVSHFKHSSVACDTLQFVQKLPHAPQWWNSWLAMIRGLLEIKNHSVIAQTQLMNMPQTLSAEEWMILKEVVSILEPFEAMTSSLSGEMFVTASHIIPLVCGLYMALSTRPALQTPLGKTFHAQVLQKVQEHLFAYEVHSRVAKRATFLDPRFKQLGFYRPEKAEETRRTVKSAVRVAQRRRQETVPSSSAEGSRGSHWEGHALLGFLSTKVQTTSNFTPTVDAAILVRQYLELPPVACTVDPIQFWDGKEDCLAEVAKSYMCVPATSVPCEKMFSKAGQIIANRRHVLSAREAATLIFLNSNQHFL